MRYFENQDGSWCFEANTREAEFRIEIGPDGRLLSGYRKKHGNRAPTTQDQREEGGCPACEEGMKKRSAQK